MYSNLKNQLNVFAIDIGSNSIHGIIANVDENGHIAELFREKASVRLGVGMSEGRIRNKEMKLALAALQKFKDESEKYYAIISAVATSAVREAKNQDEFLQKVRHHTGIEVKVITGKEEGDLICKAVRSQISSNTKYFLIIDIGGGSTEIILASDKETVIVESLKLGAIRTSGEFFNNYITDPDSIDKCMAHINKTMSPVIEKLSSYKFDVVVGTSGTTQALGKMVLADRGDLTPPNYLNNIKFNSSEILKITDKILTLPKPKQRMGMPGLEQSRAEIISVGSMILKNFLNELKINEIVVSSYGLREGVVFDTFDKMNITN